MQVQAEVSPRPKSSIRSLIIDMIDKANIQHIVLPEKVNGRNLRCPVIQIPLKLPIYRIDSSRTKDAQDLMIQNGSVTEDTFDIKNEYVKESQQAQHQILCKMSKDSPNLFDLFEDEDPSESKFFHMTLDGVLINGNCRTATLREMNAQGNGRDSFNSIWVAVIKEPLERDELTKIELNMQLEDPWELKYDWIQLTTHINNQRRIMTEQEVASSWEKYNLEKMVGYNYTDLIRMRTELDTYLEDSNRIGQIEKFRELKGYTQLLNTHSSSLANKKLSEYERNEIRALLYVELNRVFSSTDSPKGRAYDRLRDHVKEVSKFDGTSIMADIENITGIKPTKEIQSSSMLDLGISVKKRVQVNLKEIAQLSGEDSLKVIEASSKKTTAKKLDRKNKNDRNGVKRAIDLASKHISDAVNYLNGDFKQYDVSGLNEKITNIKEKLDVIEDIVK